MCITHVVASSTHQNASDTWRVIINFCAVISLRRTVMNMPFPISLLTFPKSSFKIQYLAFKKVPLQVI